MIDVIDVIDVGGAKAACAVRASPRSNSGPIAPMKTP
jgi:hypothetical protein